MKAMLLTMVGAYEGDELLCLISPERSRSPGAGVDGVPPSGKRLHTATLRLANEDEERMTFHAAHASSRTDLLESLQGRIATRHLGRLEIVEGIDPDHPVVRRLVPSGALARLAEHGDVCPTSRPLGGGGVLHIIEAVKGRFGNDWVVTA